MKNKKILITGASGFLGSHLVEGIKDDEQFRVVALSSQPDMLKDRIGGSNITYLHKDSFFQDSTVFNEAIVVNCAYPRNSTGMMVADGLKYIKDVFETAVENKAVAIINVSSQSVYSQQREKAATEETPVCLESPYAVGKYAVELMLESICKNKSTAFTNIRMASLIGPGFEQRIVNRFVKQAVETSRLTVNRNQQKFGFFDIEDAVSGLMKMLYSDSSLWKPIYVLGNHSTVILTELAESIQNTFLSEEYQKVIEITIEDSQETLNSAVDASLFYETFSFEPKISISDSIRRIIESYI